MNLEYVFQPKVRGTADATALAGSHVKEDFLLIYGDLLVTPKVIKSILQAHKESSSASMAVVSIKHPEHYGIVKLSKGAYVKDIIEKPRSDKIISHLANAGIYTFSISTSSKPRIFPVRSYSASVITIGRRRKLQPHACGNSTLTFKFNT